MRIFSRRGFSLLEMTLALGIGGVLLSAVWQLMGVSSQTRESVAISSQSLAVATASQSYINAQAAVLVTLPGLATLNSAVRVKITDADTGDTATSVLGLGYLPQGFNNMNSYGQSYALFVRREDGGTIGVADAGDSLTGLLLTTGGAPISDNMGGKISANIGAGGGFIFASDNPASPTAAVLVRGTTGGWQADLTATGWANIGAVATAGHLGILTGLQPSSGSTGGGGASTLDDLDDSVTDYSNSSMYVGKGAGDVAASAIANTAIGLDAFHAVTSGGSNTTTGALALTALTIGGSNTAIGRSAGANITSGSSNIVIGSNSSVPNAAGSNQFNIGNKFYGNLSTGQFNFGSSTFSTDLALDVNGSTNSTRLASGTSAQRPTCDASHEGAQRYDNTLQSFEVCNGGGWYQLDLVSSDSSPQQPAATSGYLVMTHDKWDGNMGGLGGANAKCLSDLTTYDWRGKSTAIANGQLTGAKVQAFLCNGTYWAQYCNNLQPLTQYYFARSGDATVGGASFQTRSDGVGPGSTVAWSPQNYFGSTEKYWSNRSYDGASYSSAYNWWGTQSMWTGNSNWAACYNWTTNDSSVNSGTGDPSVGDTGTSSSTFRRYTDCCTSCAEQAVLVCIVNP